LIHNTAAPNTQCNFRPPGTGKTSTICGLVAAYLSKRSRPATTVNVGRTNAPTDKWSLKKLLVCAPSNAAIDEVAHRIKEGARVVDGRATKVVRIGADKTINISVKDISLDYLVEQKLNPDSNSPISSREASYDIAALRVEIENVKRAKQQKLVELSNVRDNTVRTLALEDEIKKLNAKRMTLTQQFDRVKDKQKSDARSLDATRRKFRAEVLYEADVICSTLSGSGHESLEQFDFEMVVIDEAAQAIELSSLIPLKYRCKRCVMVGGRLLMSAKRLDLKYYC
jgi:senataxin